MIALREEHLALQQSVAGWLAGQDRREGLEGDTDPVRSGWSALAAQGWSGLHLPEPHGSGYGLLELCVVLEQAGRAGLPGPLLPTVLLSALLHRAGAEVPPGLVDGTMTGTVAWRSGDLTGSARGDELAVTGTLTPVLCAGSDLVLAPVDVAGDRRWCLLDRRQLVARPLTSLDLTRRVGELQVDALVPADRQLVLDDRMVDATAALLLSAEATGIAGWCLETATAHALVREQFGHKIGHFQAVKHACADMLVAVEQSAAAVWDAAVAADGSVDLDEAELAACIAASIAPEAAFAAAKKCIQLLGGIGFTWEHDAQLYLRRATAVRALLGGPDPWRQRVAGLSRQGVTRRPTLELPAEADAVRSRVRGEVASLAGASDLRRALALGGWLEPHLPPPAGRSASPLEQLVIDDELSSAGVERPHLEVGAWALPTLLEHGTPEQQERWVLPTLLGEITWCQLFSEPGAGSDLASLKTAARPVDGGYAVTGQKVWTTFGALADFGILLARTDPDQPRHAGISYFVLDMRTAGVDVRPLRELTGEAMFSEVFFDEVFVPDDCLIGALHGGWAVTRSTLAHERVSIAGGTSFGGGLDEVVRMAADQPSSDLLDARLGALVAEAHTVAMLGLRSTTRALAGTLGAEAAVRKLLGAEHEQRVLELGVELLHGDGTHLSTEAAETWVGGFLGGRCLTIAGGTSEVQRNVIAERMLGLPRDVNHRAKEKQ